MGIVGSNYVVQRFWGELPVAGTPTAYVEAVLAAGALPVVLPLRSALLALPHVDALVLTGGGDVDPRLYDGDPAEATDVDADRDRAEIDLLEAAASCRVPLLAVCRGLQILAVAHGARLTNELGTTHVHPGTGHPVRTRPGSLLGELLGETPDVSALHHQAVVEPTAPLTATAWADDGVVEACEWAGPDPWPMLAVQWHPELDTTGPALFGWLAASTRGDTADHSQGHG